LITFCEALGDDERFIRTAKRFAEHPKDATDLIRWQMDCQEGWAASAHQFKWAAPIGGRAAMSTRHLSNKARQYSALRLGAAIQTIETVASREQKRESVRRRRKMEQAHESLSIHADRLGIQIPDLGNIYQPEEYLAHARLVAEQLAGGEQS